jgi:hypothetical protein
MDNSQDQINEEALASKLYRIIIVATESTESVFFDGKLIAKGSEMTGETVANLAEDRGLQHGEYFILVVGLPIDYPLGDALAEQDYEAFGLTKDY